MPGLIWFAWSFDCLIVLIFDFHWVLILCFALLLLIYALRVLRCFILIFICYCGSLGSFSVCFLFISLSTFNSIGYDASWLINISLGIFWYRYFDIIRMLCLPISDEAVCWNLAAAMVSEGDLSLRLCLLSLAWSTGSVVVGYSPDVCLSISSANCIYFRGQGCTRFIRGRHRLQVARVLEFVFLERRVPLYQLVSKSCRHRIFGRDVCQL